MPVPTQRHPARERGAIMRRWLAALIVAIVAPLAAQSALAQGAATPATNPAAAIPPASCPVTIPNGSVPPFGNLGFFPGPVFHGEHGIWASFGPDGTVAWQPAMGDGPGAYGVKFLWFHDERARGHLQVTGTYLGGTAPPLVAEVPNGYPVVGYQASGLIFSRLGCWRITASAGGSSMTFTIWLYEGEPMYLPSTWTSPTPPPYCHVTRQPSAGANPAALRTGPSNAIATGNEQLVAFLPPSGTFVVTAPSMPQDSLSTPFTGVVLTWWQNPLNDIQPLISAERTTGYGGSGTIDYDLQAAAATGMRKTPVAFANPGCWQVELRAGQSSATFTLWLWTRELPPAATPVATPAA